jgi:hypothetical protein
MNSFIIQCIICGAIPLLAIPINSIICKYLIKKELQTEQVNNEGNVESNNEIKNTNRYECQICGALFELNNANRYLIVEDEAPLTAMFSVPATYECFDCPKCGCQNRVNERKGGHIIDEQTKADTDEHL